MLPRSAFVYHFEKDAASAATACGIGMKPTILLQISDGFLSRLIIYRRFDLAMDLRTVNTHRASKPKITNIHSVQLQQLHHPITKMVQTRSQAANGKLISPQCIPCFPALSLECKQLTARNLTAQGKKKIPAPKRTKLQEDDDDESEDEQQAPAVPKTKAAKKAKLPKSPVKNSSAPAPVMSARIIGQVDPEFAQKKGSETTVACDDDDHLYDAMLCMVEGTSDKYYVLQVIEYDDKYVCFARWGRTGAKGQQQTLGPFTDLSEAVAAFEDKFTEKTGNTWSDFVEGGFKHQKGKYDCLVSPISGNVQAARAAGVEWEVRSSLCAMSFLH